MRQKNRGRNGVAENLHSKNGSRKSVAEKSRQQYGWGLFMRDMEHLVWGMFCNLGFSSWDGIGCLVLLHISEKSRQKNHGRKSAIEKLRRKNHSRKSAVEKSRQQHGWGISMRDMAHLVWGMFCELWFSSWDGIGCSVLLHISDLLRDTIGIWHMGIGLLVVMCC